MKTRSTVVLTERQRGLLQIALEIARDKFLDNVRVLKSECTSESANRLEDQFDKQAEDTSELLNMITLADEITLMEEIKQ